MKMETVIEKMHATPKQRVLAHLLFWILLGLVQWYLNSISFNLYRNFPTGVRLLLLVTDFANIMFFYYALVYLILPKLMSRQRILGGILAVLLFATLYAWSNTLQERFILGSCNSCMEVLRAAAPDYYRFLQSSQANRLLGKVVSLGSFIGLLYTIALPLAIKMSLQAFRQQVRSARLQQENLQLQLGFLKAQVNPHFLFNTLNNLYGFILKGDKRSAQLVERLSQFLRYSLYESPDEMVAVEKEVRLLRDYESLEAIRLNHTKVAFQYSNDGSVSRMPPLLLVPVLENAFKYSVDEPGASIIIQFRVKEKGIHCLVENQFDPMTVENRTGGIGLDNLRKRLELYYPGQYDLHAVASGTRFTVTLKITGHE